MYSYPSFMLKTRLVESTTYASNKSGARLIRTLIFSKELAKFLTGGACKAGARKKTCNFNSFSHFQQHFDDEQPSSTCLSG